MIRRSLILTAVVLIGAATALVVRSLSSNPTVLASSLSRADARTRSSSRRSRAAAEERDPLATAAVRSYLRRRPGTITAAVEDLRTGRTWLDAPAVRVQTASIVKVDILEALLRRAQVTGVALDGGTTELATEMIENSDDDAATDLWDALGGSAALARYDAEAGLTQTVPNSDGYWGETTTSALDQIRLLRQLVDARGLLDRASRADELDLMTHVEADQTWGVSAGVPAGVDVALKDGWVPLTDDSDWEMNSIGRVDGDGRDYLIAVLTAHDASEAQGIATIEGLSRMVWARM